MNETTLALVREKEEVQHRLARVANLIDNEGFAEMAVVDLTLLMIQKEHMQGYLAALIARIDREIKRAQR